MHRLALALAALALLAPAPAALSAPAPAEGPTRLPWELLDCTYLIALVPVTDTALRPLLPEGYEPGPPVLAAPVAGFPLHEIGIELDDCARGTGLDGYVEGMQYASVWVGVQPPSDPEPPPATGYFVNFDVLVPDADRRALLQAHGLPARDGALRIEGPKLLADQRHAAVLEMEGLGNLRFESVDAVVPQNFDSDFLQFTQTTDGQLATWFVKYKSTELRRGAGTVEVAPGSWLADLVGLPSVPARFLVGQWDYFDGEIVLP